MSCSERFYVGDGKNNVADCVAAVKALWGTNNECSDRFFYAPSRGWCRCEPKGQVGPCPGVYNNYGYNEYRLTGVPVGTSIYTS